MDCNNQTLVQQQFRPNGHDFKRHTESTFIDRIENDRSIKSIIEKKKKRTQIYKKSENICGIWI